jgi:hypothetical protein
VSEAFCKAEFPQPAKDFDLGLMEITVSFCDRILNQNYAVVMSYSASQRCRDTNGGGHASNNTGCHTHKTKDRVERSVLEAAIPLLDDDVFIIHGLEFVRDLRPPRALEEECSIAAG